MECTTTTAMKTTAMNTKNRNWKRTRPLVAFAALLLLGLIGIAPAAAASADNTQPARVPIAETSAASKSAVDSTGTGLRPAASTTGDATRYASREKSAGQQENFRGGSASIYIGGSALTIALVIILLIIIL